MNIGSDCDNVNQTQPPPPILIKTDSKNVKKVMNILAGKTKVIEASKKVNKTLKKNVKATSRCLSQADLKLAKLSTEDIRNSKSGNGKRFGCKFCPEGYNKLIGLALHMNYFHDIGDDNKYPCVVCDNVEKTSGRLSLHIEIQHNDIDQQEIQYRCGINQCDFVASSKPQLMEHKTAKHKVTYGHSDEVLKCDLEGCNFETHNVYRIKQHKLQSHGPRNFTCDQCGKAFVKQHGLDKHMDSVHLGVVVYCEKCGKSFKTSSSLKYHRKSQCNVLTVQDKEYQCQECPEVLPFSTLKHYIQHYRVKHGKVPPDLDRDKVGILECDKCNFFATNSEGLRRHQKIVHEVGRKVMPRKKKAKKQREEPSQCPDCGKTFLKVTSLNEHIKSVHEGDTPFQCKHCPRSFGTSIYLRMHVGHSHANKTCDVCGKTFGSQIWFKRHMAQAHGVFKKGSVNCDICSTVFDSENHLRRHVKNKHSG